MVQSFYFITQHYLLFEKLTIDGIGTCNSNNSEVFTKKCYIGFSYAQYFISHKISSNILQTISLQHKHFTNLVPLFCTKKKNNAMGNLSFPTPQKTFCLLILTIEHPPKVPPPHPTPPPPSPITTIHPLILS